MPLRRRAATRGPGSRRAFPRLAPALVAGLAFILNSCGSKDASGPPPTPAAITKVAGDLLSGSVGAAVATRPAVRIDDANGKPIAGVAVRFAVTGGLGSSTGDSVVTAADGIARVGSWTLGTLVGANTLSASVGGALSATFSATGTPGSPASVAANSAASQSSTAGAAVLVRPSVKVRDVYGNLTPGAQVTFTVTAGGGSVTGGVDTTDALGVATVGSWTLGTAAGADTLSATVAGVAPLRFVATAVAGTPTSMVLNAGQGQSAQEGTLVPIAPSVRIKDANGNDVSGVGVSFTVTAGGGQVTGGLQTTDSAGVATVGSWRLGGTIGTNTLHAAGAGLTFDFTATGAVGAAKLIAVASGNNQAATVGTAVAAAPTAVVTDSGGNPVAGVIVTFAVASGGGSVTKAVDTADAQGLVAPTAWTLGTTAGANTLTASSPGLSTATFSATGTAGAATTFAKVAGDGQTGTAGVTLAAAPTARLTDAFANGVSGVKVACAVTTGGGTAPDSARSDSAGRAAFPWKLGDTPGANSLTCSSAGFADVVFTATGASGAASLAKQAGDGQSATVASAVATAPSVLVKDALNNPLSGISVTFAPSAGGAVTGGSATTNGSGIATVGSWTLASTAGTNRLVATVAGLPADTFSATGLAAAASQLTMVAGNNQTALVGVPVAAAPSVKAADQFGNGVANVAIAFQVASGGGSVTGGSVNTAGNGVATVGTWTMGGSPGTNTLTATSTPALGGSPLTFTASAITSQFNISVRFVGTISASRQQVFLNAAAKWQNIIIGDIPDLDVTGNPIPAGACFPGQPEISEVIDDVIIYAELDSIDGPGKILGQAGPCFVRSTSRLPLVGIMHFDTADVAGLESSGNFQEVITHEMGHVLGFGVIWTDKGLLTGAGGGDPFFTGANAINAFLSVGGASYTGSPVPVENTGGAGTADAHWRESVLKNELMTGYLNAGVNPVSIITVQSMADLGYTVNPFGADAYTVSFPLLAPGATPTLIHLMDDIIKGPIYTVDRSGRRTLIRPR